MPLVCDRSCMLACCGWTVGGAGVLPLGSWPPPALLLLCRIFRQLYEVRQGNFGGSARADSLPSGRSSPGQGEAPRISRPGGIRYCARVPATRKRPYPARPRSAWQRRRAPARPALRHTPGTSRAPHSAPAKRVLRLTGT